MLYVCYANEWSLYQNHFCPSMKLLEKKRINSKYLKKYDPPRTPYDRVLATYLILSWLGLPFSMSHHGVTMLKRPSGLSNREKNFARSSLLPSSSSSSDKSLSFRPAFPVSI